MQDVTCRMSPANTALFVEAAAWRLFSDEGGRWTGSGARDCKDRKKLMTRMSFVDDRGVMFLC